LAAGLALLLEGIVRKSSIITMIVLDVGTVPGSKVLNLLLGKDVLSGRVSNLEVHKTQTGVLVHKNSAIPVPLLGECPFQLGNKSHLCQFQLDD
jgi:hypothetical protein